MFIYFYFSCCRINLQKYLTRKPLILKGLALIRILTKRALVSAVL